MKSRILVRNDFFPAITCERVRALITRPGFFPNELRTEALHHDSNIRGVFFVDSNEVDSGLVYACIERCQKLQSAGCKVMRHLNISRLHRTQVIKYTSKCDPNAVDGSLNFHLDGDEGSTLLSLVITIKSVDCKGADLVYDNADNGMIGTEKRAILELSDNSAYVMPGSQVLHGVTPIISGVRYALVFVLLRD